MPKVKDGEVAQGPPPAEEVPFPSDTEILEYLTNEIVMDCRIKLEVDVGRSTHEWARISIPAGVDRVDAIRHAIAAKIREAS